MAKNKEEAKELLREAYEENTILFLASGIHRSHKNQKLLLEAGSYLEGIYRDKNPYLVVKKATQCGISEYLIARSFYRVMRGKSILYILPTYDLKNQFVRERVDKTFMFTEFYRRMSGNQETKLSDNMSIKQVGAGTIVFAGSNTANAFISFPADDIIIDELDNCHKDNVVMADERQSASTDKTTVKVANPTITGTGIDAEYKKTDMKEWNIYCENCRTWFRPDFFEHVVEQKHKDVWILRDKGFKGIGEPKPIHNCGVSYNRYAKGKWTATAKSERSGYHISKMFSTQVTLNELIEKFKEGLVNETVMQRFYNGDLGLAFSSSGSKITLEMLMDCVGEYIMPDSVKEPCVAGVDIGTINNIIISTYAEPSRVVFIGIARDLIETFSLFKRYNVRCFVVDAQPETREAIKMCRRWKFGLKNYYTNAKTDISINIDTLTVNTNRTISLDAVKEKLMLKQIVLPANAPNIPEFFAQMQASTRVYDEEKEVFNWEHGSSEPDHYHHAFAYMLTAKRVMSSMK